MRIRELKFILPIVVVFVLVGIVLFSCKLFGANDDVEVTLKNQEYVASAQEIIVDEIKNAVTELKTVFDNEKLMEKFSTEITALNEKIEQLLNDQSVAENAFNQECTRQMLDVIEKATDELKKIADDNFLAARLSDEEYANQTSEEIKLMAEELGLLIDLSKQETLQKDEELSEKIIQEMVRVTAELSLLVEQKSELTELLLQEYSELTIEKLTEFSDELRILIDEAESKTSLNIEYGTSRTLEQLKKNYEELQKLLADLRLEEKINEQNNTAQVTEKINFIYAELTVLINQFRSEQEKEIKNALTQTISEIKSEAANIKQLVEQTDFEEKLLDQTYAQQTMDEIKKVTDSIKVLIDNTELQDRLRDEKYADDIMREIQTISTDLQSVLLQVQRKQDETMQLLAEQAIEEMRQMIEELKISLLEDLYELVCYKRAKDDEVPKKEWTSIVYMAADNNLEASAIQDINEMESATFDDSYMNILVLLDRAVGYDGTNEDWTDTRLFRIQPDSNGLDGTIKSKRIDCPELDLYRDKVTELDMASPYTLSGLLNFAKRKYVANHYALIIWGHGTGWRGTSINCVGTGDTKAVAVDKQSNSYMSVPALGRAVNGKGLDIIAFDTCFGAVIENFYELKNSATYLVGAAGIVPADGFDYSKMLKSFLSSNKSVSSFATCIANSSSEAISVVKASDIQSIANGINSLAADIASSIQTRSQREAVYNVLFNNVKSYGENYYPSDLFLDVYDLARIYSSSDKTSIKNLSINLLNTINRTISTTNSSTPKIGLYFISLLSRTCPSPSHSDYYINGVTTSDKSAFVNEMTGWVPTKNGNQSLLDKLFYTVL